MKINTAAVNIRDTLAAKPPEISSPAHHSPRIVIELSPGDTSRLMAKRDRLSQQAGREISIAEAGRALLINALR